MLKRAFILILLLMSATSPTLAQGREKTIEEIKKMDKQWQVESYSSRDLKDYDRIVAEDFLITGGNGKILTKAEKRANVKADYTELHPATFSRLTRQATKYGFSMTT